jgi:dephospho-CoA kinase
MDNKMILLGGQPASGKTTLGKLLAGHYKISFFDKDLICDKFTNFITSRMTYKYDRSTSFYYDNIRNLEYDTLLNLGYEHAKLGISSISISPFTTEFKSDDLIEKMNSKLKEYNNNFELICIMINSNPQNIKERLISRKRDEDNDKLQNWDSYIETKLSANVANCIKVFINDDLDTTFNDIIDYLDSI